MTIKNVRKFKNNTLIRSHNLSILLSVWVYIYAIFYFVPLVIPSNTLLMYFILLVIAVFALLNTMSVRRGLITFVVCYVVSALMNMAVVSYPYYAAVDAFSGLAVFLPALLIISSHYFNLMDFSITWYRAAVFSTVITPFAIILMQEKYIDYGVFTYLNLPNAVIFSYIALITKKDKRKKICYCSALINFAVILFFGGRMAAFAAAFAIFAGYMLSTNISVIKKTGLIIIAIIAIVVVMNDLNRILYVVQNILNRYNLSSRSVALLIEQFRTSGMGFYLSGRNIIYDEILNYISTRNGLPGGFGVSLAITNGKYYHPHNLILQLIVMLGIMGAIAFLIIILYKIYIIKKTYKTVEYRFIILFLLDYFVISFTGGSILTNYVAIIGVGMLFFYKPSKVDFGVEKRWESINF